jgi:hypothetical protein
VTAQNGNTFSTALHCHTPDWLATWNMFSHVCHFSLGCVHKFIACGHNVPHTRSDSQHEQWDICRLAANGNLAGHHKARTNWQAASLHMEQWLKSAPRWVQRSPLLLNKIPILQNYSTCPNRNFNKEQWKKDMFKKKWDNEIHNGHVLSAKL